MTEYLSEYSNEKGRFGLLQNHFGQYWPIYETKVPGCGWYPVTIRDSNPFKTRAGAIRFIQKTKERIDRRNEKIRQAKEQGIHISY